jgi:hypothetical protein
MQRSRDLVWLSWGLVGAVAMPWLIGHWVKAGLQPGLVDNAAHAARLVDYMVIGAMVFGLSMWIVAAFACWIVRVMQGPRRDGDPFPPEQSRHWP